MYEFQIVLRGVCAHEHKVDRDIVQDVSRWVVARTLGRAQLVIIVLTGDELPSLVDVSGGVWAQALDRLVELRDVHHGVQGQHQHDGDIWTQTDA
jgi:hypothetical protein